MCLIRSLSKALQDFGATELVRKLRIILIEVERSTLTELHVIWNTVDLL